MVLKVVEYPAPVLSKPARRVGEKDVDRLSQLYEDMVETMNDYRGIGLAAPQVGEGIRFMIAHDTQSGQTRPFVNPQIKTASSECDVRGEGCLSFPGLYADIERHASILLKFQDLELNEYEEEFSGFFARVIQHELDHLNGVLLVDRAIDGLYEPEYEDEDEEPGDGSDPQSMGTGEAEPVETPESR